MGNLRKAEDIIKDIRMHYGSSVYLDELKAALSEVVAESSQSEPVAWMHGNGNIFTRVGYDKLIANGVTSDMFDPLYAHPNHGKAKELKGV